MPTRSMTAHLAAAAKAVAVAAWLAVPGPAHASLALYDAAVAADAEGGGPVPTARLESAVAFDGSDAHPFDFGETDGPVTMEFIVEGDPVAGGGDGYLAVGANSSSNLRYEQWNDTGQLGFTQLGVEDYRFTPSVASPTEPAHLAFAWDGGGRMDLYVDGILAGTNTGVAPGFGMPTGAGFLGNNAARSEGMVGTIHRVTVYDEAVDAAVLRRHAEAFNDVARVPTILAFTASPDSFLSPGSTTLAWETLDAESVSIDGTDVTGLDRLVVSPPTTTTFTLTTANAEGSATAEVVVTVNPPPVIEAFAADREVVDAGEAAVLSWTTRFATGWSITPDPGDVTAATVDGAGSTAVMPAASTTYLLTATGPTGTATAEATVAVAKVADHPVISEFMAANDSVLADGDGDYSDWIEILNPTGSPVDLAGHFLTDDPGNLGQWALPAVVLAPGERLVVFASGKGPGGPAGEWHANFRLDAGGEFLALVAPDAATVIHGFVPAFPPQWTDVSYGILDGDTTRVRFMGSPTPGARNDAASPAPGPVAFGEPSRTFTGTLDVALAPDPRSPDAIIRFTTDGSEPTAARGTPYEGPVRISATTHLRAVAIAGDATGPVSGGSYVRLAPDLAAYEADLPLLVIDNFGGGTIPAKGWSGTGAGVQQRERQPAVWATFARSPEDGMAALSDAPQMMSRIGIRGRGAFSSTWRQKPYSVEAWDEAGSERDVEVLGMPKHADWVLYYPDIDTNKDPAMMFNTFMFELSRDIGRYATRFRWVEAFINEDGGDLSLSDRRGVYAIVEKVSRGSDRLDFEALAADGATGGWLLGLNRMDAIPPGGFPAENGATRPQFFHTKGPNRIAETAPNNPGGGDDIPRQSNGFLNFDNPGGYTINTAQRAAIEGWFDTFEDVLYDDARWRDPDEGYRRFLDPEDFVDYFMFNNLSRNGDGMLISMFPWLGDDGRLRMGPAWDYNWSSYYVGGSATGTLWHRRDRLWYGRLFADPDFEQLYIDRWFRHRDGPMSNAAIEAIIDGQAAEIGPERAIRQGFATEAAWRRELTTFKNWLTTRADWFDRQFVPRPVLEPPGGTFAERALIGFAPGEGTIYFTLDGTDPRDAGGAVAAAATPFEEGAVTWTTLVGTGHAVRAMVPSADDPPTGADWTLAGFDDSAWPAGTTGVGYERSAAYKPEIAFDLEPAMDGVNTSAYLRLAFELTATDASAYDALTLRMKYDDGFIAYLNGVEIARANAPASPAWDSSATAPHPDFDALEFADFPVADPAGLLVPGTNVLAAHGLNDSVVSSDFLIVPELAAGRTDTAGAATLHESAVVTARTRVGARWSAPVAAWFFVDTGAPGPENLVVSEIHYRPADVSPEEAAAGFSNRDDFEFIELMNTGARTLDLSGVRLARVAGAGIDFDFSSADRQVLAPGGRLLVVKDRSAFAARNGPAASALVAGEFDGNLSNDGERLTLLAPTGDLIRAFTYNDRAPWPESPDGGGFSLVLIDPARQPPPDHDDPLNWRASLATGGTPGSGDGTTYGDWRAAQGLPATEANPDPDGDGRDSFLEYVQGTAPLVADAGPDVDARIEPVDGGGAHVVIAFERNPAADDAVAVPESSSDLRTWSGGPETFVFLGREAVREGREVLVFRSAEPVPPGGRLFVRIRAESR